MEVEPRRWYWHGIEHKDGNRYDVVTTFYKETNTGPMMDEREESRKDLGPVPEHWYCECDGCIVQTKIRQHGEDRPQKA